MENDTNSLIRSTIRGAPNTFGVYTFCDKEDKPIYIGKARNLRRRLSQYLKEEANSKMWMIIARAHQVSWNLCNSQAEALLLEAQKVRALQPKYNILLKDDKTMPGIVLNTIHDFPSIQYQRKPHCKEVKYYGPFSDASAVKNVINTIRKVYLLRNCSDKEFTARKKPCLEYQIKRCSAPCVNMISKETYQQHVNEVCEILAGNQKELRERLVKLMDTYAENMDFEKAAAIRDRITSLTFITHHAKHYNIQGNADIIVLIREEQHCCIQVSYIRNGGNCGNDNFYLQNTLDEDTGAIMEQFMVQFYIQHIPPERIITNCEPQEIQNIKDLLQDKVDYKVEIFSQKGLGVDLAKALINDIEVTLKQHIARRHYAIKNLLQLHEQFMLPKIPNRIEVFDNSHISGSNAVGVMIVVNEGNFARNKYRRYNFKNSFKAEDDYAMMHEMLSRRLLDIKQSIKAGEISNNIMPDLWIVDGGEGHMSVAKSVMQEIQIHIPCICIAKGPQRNAGNEEFFASTTEGKIKLERNSSLLYYLQKLRDEAHRFAITSHRNKRIKETTNSVLENIAGVGLKRKLTLLRYFGSVMAIKNAPLDAIMSAPGIDHKTAHKVYDYLRKNS